MLVHFAKRCFLYKQFTKRSRTATLVVINWYCQDQLYLRYANREDRRSKLVHHRVVLAVGEHPGEDVERVVKPVDTIWNLRHTPSP